MTEPQLAATEECQEKTATETSQETREEHAQNDNPLPAEVPGKAKRGRPRKNFPEVRNRRVCFRFISIMQIVGDSQRAERSVEYDEVTCSGLNLARVNIVFIIIVLLTFLAAEGTGRWCSSDQTTTRKTKRLQE